MSKKKTLSLVVIIIVVLLLAACGQDDASGEQPPDPARKTKIEFVTDWEDAGGGTYFAEAMINGRRCTLYWDDDGGGGMDCYGNSDKEPTTTTSAYLR